MKVINGWVDTALEIDYGNKSFSRNGWKPLIIVLHGTAGGSSAQDIAVYFRDGAEQASAHFVIGQDGTVVQGISCDVAAWGNGLTTTGHAPFLPDSNVVNGNWYTISIEHCKPHDDNSDQLTDAQKNASFALVDALCSAYSIPRKVATDMNGGVLGHHDFDPENRSRCPGPYPTDELISYLNNGGEHVGIPANWHDDGTTLTAPNNIPVVHGFRDYILTHPWDEANIPLEPEHGASQLEMSNPSLGGGTKQRFRWTTLEWTSKMGVFVAWTGQELIALEQKVAQLTQQLQSNPAPTPTPTIPPVILDDAKAVLAAVAKLKQDAGL